MIAIEVTEENKKNNKLKQEIGSFYRRNTYPNEWWGDKRVIGGYADMLELHKKDGWKELVTPEYDPKKQKLGGIVYYEPADIFMFNVIDLSDEAIQNNALQQAESDKQEQLMKTAEMQIVGDAQLYDDTASLDAQALFPIWNGEGEKYQLGFKVQSFLANNELVLYRVVQAHTSQPNWLPRDNPALFTRIAYPDQILPWVQPTGAQDAYNIGDKVNYEGINYESTVDANVYAPLVVAGQWIEV